jgi:hypothetical protein
MIVSCLKQLPPADRSAPLIKYMVQWLCEAYLLETNFPSEYFGHMHTYWDLIQIWEYWSNSGEKGV